MLRFKFKNPSSLPLSRNSTLQNLSYGKQRHFTTTAPVAVHVDGPSLPLIPETHIAGVGPAAISVQSIF